MTPSYDKQTHRITFTTKDAAVAIASLLVCLGAAAIVFADPSAIVAVSVYEQPARVSGMPNTQRPRLSVSADAASFAPDGAAAAAEALTPGLAAAGSADDPSSDMVPDAPLGADPTTTTVAALPALVYGSVVDTSNKPVRGATVVITRYVNGVSRRAASLTSSGAGLFSTSLADPSGTYRIVASADMGGRTVRGSTTFEPQAGVSYGVKVTLIEKSYFMFAPIPGY